MEIEDTRLVTEDIGWGDVAKVADSLTTKGDDVLVSSKTGVGMVTWTLFSVAKLVSRSRETYVVVSDSGILLLEGDTATSGSVLDAISV